MTKNEMMAAAAKVAAELKAEGVKATVNEWGNWGYGAAVTVTSEKRGRTWVHFEATES